MCVVMINKIHEFYSRLPMRVEAEVETKAEADSRLQLQLICTTDSFKSSLGDIGGPSFYNSTTPRSSSLSEAAMPLGLHPGRPSGISTSNLL